MVDTNLSTIEKISDDESDMDQCQDEFRIETLSDDSNEDLDGILVNDGLSKYKLEYFHHNSDKLEDIRGITNEYDRIKIYDKLFPEAELINGLKNIDITQISIENYVNMVINYTYPPSVILQLMYDIFISISVEQNNIRLGIFYVYNHLIQLYTNPNVWNYNVSFIEVGLHKFCIPAIIHTNNIKCNNIIHINTLINIWRQRQIYSNETCNLLESYTRNNLIARGLGYDLRENFFSNDSSLFNNSPTNSNDIFTINNEIGDLKSLDYLLHTPLTDNIYKDAINDIDVNIILDSIPNEYNKSLHDSIKNNKHLLFNKSNRISGQELIILHSISLDLAALIEENDRNFILLQKEIDKLTMLLHGK